MDPERVEGLLGEIEGMDGNAGAVVGAVTEVRASNGGFVERG